jgi:hypothetical protein
MANATAITVSPFEIFFIVISPQEIPSFFAWSAKRSRPKSMKVAQPKIG